MSAPPRPRRQNDLLTTLQVFAEGISGDPARYHIAEDDARVMQEAVDAFAQALEVTSHEDTNTRVTVRKKDDTRRTAEELHSRFYNLIKADPEIPDTDKIAIGVRPVNLERTPIRVPGTVPLLQPIMGTPHRHVLRFHDARTPDSAGKPEGAVFLQLYAAIGKERDVKVDQAREVGLFTRNPILVDHPSEDDGRRVTYFARWISRKGEKGPWSVPASMTIMA